MTKLVFPGAGKPYRGFISEMRTWFQVIASHARQSPTAKATINEQLAVLAAATGYEPPLPDGTGTVTNNDVYSVPDGETSIVIRAVVTGNTVSFVLA